MADKWSWSDSRDKNGKKIISFFPLFAIFLICLCSDNKTENEDTIKIGAVVPLTGVDAAWGEVVASTLLYAEKEINSEGGVLGKKLKVSICDYGGDPDTARSCVERFASKGIKFVIGPDGSEALLSGICGWGENPDLVEQKRCPFIIENQVLIVATWPTSPFISDIEDDGLIFRVCPSDRFQASVLAEHVLSQGITKVSVIYRDDWDGREFAKIFKNFFENPPEGLTKGVVLSFIPYPPEKTEEFSQEV